MDIISIIVSLFVVSILIAVLLDLTLAIALYISYTILVPYMSINLGGITLGYNLITTFILIVFLFRVKFKYKLKINYVTIKPFVGLYLALLFLTFLQWEMPWSLQFGLWRPPFMAACIIPFVLWNLFLLEPQKKKYVLTAIILSTVVSCLYGLFLIKLSGFNPYITYLTNYFGVDDYSVLYADKGSRGGLSIGRIQSTMSHPMTWAFFLVLISLFFLSSLIRKYTKLNAFLAILTFVCLVLCGVRTGLVAFLVSIVYYLFVTKRIKAIVAATAFSILLLSFIDVGNGLIEYFSSLFDLSGRSNVEGSSIGLRLEQLSAAVDIIGRNELVGKGYGWSQNYMAVNGYHPILLSFESLIFVVLVDSGFIGTVIWAIFFFSLFTLNRKVLMFKDEVYLADAFVIAFLVYAIGTGLYSYLEFFALYYIVFLSSLSLRAKNVFKYI